MPNRTIIVGLPDPIPDPLVELLANRLQVIGEPTRIRVLDRLRHGPASVQQLVDAAGTTQQNVSKHLTRLSEHEWEAQSREELIAREAAREAAAREEAARKAEEAEAVVAEGAAESLGGYAGWLCETAANTGQAVQGCGGSGVYGNHSHFTTDIAVRAHCGSMYVNKPCHHSGGGGRPVETGCAIVGIADLIPGVAATPVGLIAGAFCAGWAAAAVATGK
jgi:DNA-binding transcriptional ArsR family regulator